MNIAFRADSSRNIGTGHVMRCLTLAAELAASGARVCFASRQHDGQIEGPLSRSPHAVHLLAPPNGPVDWTGAEPPAHANWLGSDWIDDVAQSAEALLGDGPMDWLVVDHYAINASWEQAFKRMHRERHGAPVRILAIDDLGDRRHDCDMLLDQNLRDSGQDIYKGLVPQGCRLLLGPRYALLRPQFRQARAACPPRNGTVRSVLVFFGGVDIDGWTGKTIEALAAVCHRAIKVVVVIGHQHPFRHEVLDRCSELGYECHVDTDTMATLMAAADLAVGAGGSATWERCCVGLPTLAVSIAANQQPLLQALAHMGGCVHLDGVRTPSAALPATLQQLLDSPGQLKAMSQTAYALVDGQGTLRVTQALN